MVESCAEVKKLGLIINPIAGMGGRVGLKGTDGDQILAKAVELGAEPQSESRARDALEKLKMIINDLLLITYEGSMGECSAQKCGFVPEVIGSSAADKTTAQDTKRAAKDMLDRQVDLLLFAGGDGTARDVYSAVGEKLVTLGIPAGVKIHSSVFAQNPRRAGELAGLFLSERIRDVRSAEVMDIDEEQYRQGRLSAQLYGYLNIPYGMRFLQTLKAGSPVSEKYVQEAIAHEVVNKMKDDFYYLIGPGTTTRAILEKLNLSGSLLGVDIVYNRKLVARDANEAEILECAQKGKSKLILTPVGGQGYLFGRGNQQISPAVLRRIGEDNVWIIASKNKINALHGRPLLLDTGDRETDTLFAGYYRITTGYNDAVIYKVDM
jgi:predicted polyphosphate/ATP-dependent NAD kinase